MLNRWHSFIGVTWLDQTTQDDFPVDELKIKCLGTLITSENFPSSLASHRFCLFSRRRDPTPLWLIGVTWEHECLLWTESLCSPNSYAETWSAAVRCSEGGILGGDEVMWVDPSWTRPVSLHKRDPRILPCPLPHVRTQQEDCHLWRREQALTTPPPSRTVRNEVRLSGSLPVCGFLLQQPEGTRTMLPWLSTLLSEKVIMPLDISSIVNETKPAPCWYTGKAWQILATVTLIYIIYQRSVIIG